MNILYIHQYFHTPYQAGSTRSYWIAQELIKNGHKVTMLTMNKKINSKLERVDIDGINVIYLNILYDNNSFYTRLTTFMKFVFNSIPVALKEKDIDLVIATSTPLTIGLPALALKWFKKKPYVFEVRDLWPEVPIQMGGLKNKFLVNLALFLEKTIYKNAKHIVALSPGMYEGVLKRKISKEKVSMIPNMSKIEEFWGREKNLGLINTLNLKKDSFKVVYFGAMNIANGMRYIIDAAEMLNNEKDIEFIFLGGGASEADLKERCIKENLKNVVFLGNKPMEELSEIVNICDVSLITFQNIPILATNSPNKLFDSLSAEKAIIVNSAGWTKDLVEDNDCGFYVDPEKPKELADKILYLREHPNKCLEMGKKARTLAETTYDKSILCAQFAELINSIEHQTGHRN
ncbi:glycosyltransferase family 4 protein [Aurantibacter crassamenti]|uniref:glycosyltransferase family 4 protein n=1 Tax=Aurantibacter crassamenti TaxID=1837375 RepID=UPI001939D393|nr:glycosyltransferase family 4 protein [Aurantibacter crassamenti]MBM1106770.1 glycosyltransferase family 4 protein [Aurantibacter crassamenti]